MDIEVCKKKVNSIQFEYGYGEGKHLMSMTAWQNGEGWTVDFGDNQIINLSWEARDALNRGLELIDDNITIKDDN